MTPEQLASFMGLPPGGLKQKDEDAPTTELDRAKRELNRRLRHSRGHDWEDAGTAVEFWKALLEFQHAIRWAKYRNLPMAREYPEHTSQDESRSRDQWRAALVKQMLTPAPDMASVIWKRRMLAAEHHRYCKPPVEAEKIERAIADDLAFLEAHPVMRKPVKKAKAQA